MHRNVWLIIKREYLERIRSKAFVLLTVLAPALVFGIVVLPAKLMSSKPSSARKVAIVSSNRELANAVADQLHTLKSNVSLTGREDEPAPSYSIAIYDDNDENQEAVGQKVNKGELDSYLWLQPDTIQNRHFTYITRNAGDFVDVETVRNAVKMAIADLTLRAAGVSPQVSETLMKPVKIETLRIDKGRVSKATGMTAFLFPLLLMMMIYMSVIFYGVAVMRSVIEEKTSRVIEVLLSSATSRELMSGKLLGVGAVGLTQLVIWSGFGLLVSSPQILALRDYVKDIEISGPVLIGFPLFFLLAYMLYSAMYAAVGAIVNSEEEAQQMQWPVLAPLILCSVLASSVIRQPNSPMAFWLSVFPFTSPIIMFVRMVVQTPPVWQVILSVVILVLTIRGMVELCARIYRTGSLMYGKRATLPEIIKWVRYAR